MASKVYSKLVTDTYGEIKLVFDQVKLDVTKLRSRIEMNREIIGYP